LNVSNDVNNSNTVVKRYLTRQKKFTQLYYIFILKVGEQKYIKVWDINEF